MSTINFETKLFKIGSWTILLLPKSASAKLPSRGMTNVAGAINNTKFQAVLEPDGRGSHWMRLDTLSAGDSVKVIMEATNDWPEPNVPTDLRKALAADLKINSLWKEITPMARWDWIRWIRATREDKTRKRRIEVAFSKLSKGIKRPCCFNRTACTVNYVSKSGILLNEG